MRTLGARLDGDSRLAVTEPPKTPLNHPYVVVHPGATAPARTWSPDRWAKAVAALTAAGHRVVVTGGPAEAGLTEHAAGACGIDLGGRTSFRELIADPALAREKGRRAREFAPARYRIGAFLGGWNAALKEVAG